MLGGGGRSAPALTSLLRGSRPTSHRTKQISSVVSTGASRNHTHNRNIKQTTRHGREKKNAPGDEAPPLLYCCLSTGGTDLYSERERKKSTKTEGKKKESQTPLHLNGSSACEVRPAEMKVRLLIAVGSSHLPEQRRVSRVCGRNSAAASPPDRAADRLPVGTLATSLIWRRCAPISLC